VNNKQVKYYLKQLPSIKKRLSENKKRYEAIGKRITRDERIVRKLDYDYSGAPEIEIYKGVALMIYDSGSGCNIEGIASDNYRHADVYLNAHNKTTFGGRLLIYGTGHGNEELSLGSDWENDEDLLKICKDFVAKAIIPKQDRDWLYSKFVGAVKKFREKE
jgi:hypothetical protein